MIKKLFPLLTSCLLFLAVPVFAQHTEHAISSSHASSGSHQSAPKQARSGTNQSKQVGPHNQQAKSANKSQARVQTQGQKPSAGVQHSNRVPSLRSNTQARQNWNGHNFNQGYFHSNFGREHSFGFRGAQWQGRPFFRGSRFFYGGAWFVLGYDVPLGWYDCPTYIDEYGNDYYLYCPLYPGIRLGVSVVF